MNEEEDDKTVFRPAQSDASPAAPAPAATTPAPEATIAIPASGKAAFPPASEATIAIPASGPASSQPPRQQRSVVGVQVGDVLNDIFEVTRFIARGGMGEVFEGCNVRRRSERVAIKVILPSLASDPKILEIFEHEADTLERLGHEALVRYRLFTEDTRLGIFYLVTDYIEGVTLSEVLETLGPSPKELIDVTRRLASGLRAAHKAGAIHRDISPDNIILEGGKLERARIIDFGIAKNTEPGSKTIIGDGVGGKLSYMAPEQLGDFSRQIGSWTDVYSLGLVILAAAQGRKADLGGNFVDAINKRRAGVDTSAAPAELRPVLDKMLAADPEQRLQTMDDVLEALKAIGKPAPSEIEAKPPTTARRKPLPRSALVWGGSALGLLLAGGLAMIAFGGDEPAPTRSTETAPIATAAQVTVAQVKQAVQAELAKVPCAWLNLTNAGGSVSALNVSFAGVAGRTNESEDRALRAVEASGATIASSDFSGVAPVSPNFCTVLDSIAPIRTAGPERLKLESTKYEVSRFPDGELAGEIGARAVLDVSLSDLNGELALFSVEDSGELTELIGSQAAFISQVGETIERLPGNEQYRLQPQAPGTGWSGFLLITSPRAIDTALVKDYQRPDWKARFDAAARANGWKAEMVWFRFVDEEPN